MRSSYDITDWYWWIAGDESKAWSSAAVAYVQPTDSAFAAWLEAGNTPTRILNEAELIDVLRQGYPAGWPGGALETLIAAGCAIVSTSAPALNGTYGLDSETRADIVAIVDGINGDEGFPPTGGTTMVWPDINGVGHTFTSTAQFVSFAAAIRNYYFSLKVASATMAAGGTASWPAQPKQIA